MINHTRSIRAKRRLADKPFEQEVALAEIGYFKGPQSQETSTVW